MKRIFIIVSLVLLLCGCYDYRELKCVPRETYERVNQNVQDPFKEYHLDNLAKGNICGGIWVVYGDKDFDVYDAYQKVLDKYAKADESKYNAILGYVVLLTTTK